MSMLLRHTFNYTLVETGMIIAVSSFAATLLGILLSVTVMDRYEQRGWFCFLAVLTTAVSYIGLLNLEESPAHEYKILAPLFFH